MAKRICTAARKPPIKITSDMLAVRKVLRLVIDREVRLGESFKRTKSELRVLLLKLIEESRR